MHRVVVQDGGLREQRDHLKKTFAVLSAIPSTVSILVGVEDGKNIHLT